MRTIGLPAKKANFLADLRRQIVGSCARLERQTSDWAIVLDDQFVVGIGTVWRLLGHSSIVVTSEDDGHQFGLSSPINAAAKANSFLRGRPLVEVTFDIRTGDLMMHFADDLMLQILTTSAGYESWQIYHKGECFAVGANGGLV